MISPLKVRPFHCTWIGLNLAITPNVGNSSVEFLVVRACVRARPWKSACVGSANGWDDWRSALFLSRPGRALGAGRLGTVNKEGINPAGQAKDLQLQKVRVLGFALELVVNWKMKWNVAFPFCFCLQRRLIIHSNPPKVCTQSNDQWLAIGKEQRKGQVKGKVVAKPWVNF